MQSTDALNENAGDPQNRVPSIADVCDQIHTGGELALETGDFLSYATMLDISLGDPLRFSEEEATAVLTTLYTELASNNELVYKVGWDLPELLLRYIDRFFVDDVGILPGMKPFRLVMALFSLLCERGNPQQLLLRTCELVLVTEGQRHTDRLAMLSLDSQPDVPPQPGSLGENDLDLGAGDSRHMFELGLGDAIQENVKFCTLFELMRFSLQRVETAYPSRFLLEACSTLLKVAEDPNADPLSLATYTRRMFLLARDFQVAREDWVSEEEMQRVRFILVNFLTHTADVVLRRYSLKWSERLYVQMRHKVTLAPPGEREFCYSETEYTRRMSEVMSRIAQLLMSYDYDPVDGVLSFVENGEIMPTTRVENMELDPETQKDNYWARAILEGPSAPGAILLTTQLHFDGSRSKRPDINKLAFYSSRSFSKLTESLGLKDQLLYWALWISNFYDEEMSKGADQDLIVEWLNMLLRVISNSLSNTEKFVTGSVVARVLRYSSPEFAYSFCIDVMKRSDSHSEQFVAVETLKMLATGMIANMEKREGTLCTATACMELTKAQRLEIAQVAKHTIKILIENSRCVPYYYLNLLLVVPTDPTTVLEICDLLDDLETSCRARSDLLPSCLSQLNLLRVGVDQLRESAKKGLNAQADQGKHLESQQ